jgi:predicted amidohydrolase YtcJ
VKYIVDGTPIERGAWTTQPYRDAPRDRGRSNFSNEELQRIVAIADDTSEPLLLHAVGDAAIEQILTTLERQAPAERWRSRRVRIEHGDMFTPTQLQRAAKLGVILVQNPVHFLLPELLAKRLGTCNAGCQPLKSAAQAGVALAIGSDGPLNPFLGIMAASVHPTTPTEALSREDAVIAYTRGAAFAEHAETDKGTIAIGKLADLAVLSQDIFTIPPDRLPATTAWMTFVGGELVYAADGAGRSMP